jgi:hypothetical protein
MLGDWVVQTDWQAAYKARPDFWTPVPADPMGRYLRRSWVANQSHVLTYHGTLLVCLWPWMLSPLYATPGFRIWTGIAASWVAHSILDRRWPVHRLLVVTGSRRFASTALGILIADQSLHMATLAALVVWWTT